MSRIKENASTMEKHVALKYSIGILFKVNNDYQPVVIGANGKESFFSYLALAHALERGAVELASLYFAAEMHFLEHIDKLAEQLAQVAPTRFFGVPLVLGRIQSGILKKLPQKKLSTVC